MTKGYTQAPWEEPSNPSKSEFKIWVGRFVDEKGEFEVLVIARNRIEATSRIYQAIETIQEKPQLVYPPKDKIRGKYTNTYIEEVGNFDFIRMKQ